MQEDAIIVYRRDFYRNCEYKAHKSVDNSKVFRENMKKRNAPDKCWACIHFGKCRIINPEDCNGYKHIRHNRQQRECKPMLKKNKKVQIPLD